jgi:chromosome-anchoring protein RacA
MKTGTVAKMLGVSPKTIQRWVKEFNIPCARNDLGHYEFTEKDIQLLKEIQMNGQKNPQRKGVVVKSEKSEQSQELFQEKYNEILARLKDHERRIEKKADEVVAYQLLQHRKEIDELIKKIDMLERRIEELEVKEAKMIPVDTTQVKDKKVKRKTLLSSIFGLF